MELLGAVMYNNDSNDVSCPILITCHNGTGGGGHPVDPGVHCDADVGLCLRLLCTVQAQPE